jgi:integrase/recombinase XerD
MSLLAPTLQAYFSRRLITQRDASPHTIASYRDTWRLLLRYAAQATGTEPSKLNLDQLDAPLIAAFLEHLTTERGCSARTRNTRLAAIRGLYRYAAPEHPEHAATIQRVLAIPPARHDHALVTYLDEPELAALLAAPDPTRWIGRRDHALLLLAAQTGLRASELVALTRADLHLGRSPHVHVLGKGRKHRITPLAKPTIAVLRAWLAERPDTPTDPLFPSRSGRRLSVDRLERLTANHAATAGLACPSLVTKNVTPHVLRHTAAMRLLHAGVDLAVIALWLGHEQVDTTLIYLHADLAIKERALERTRPPDATPGRYRPSDPLLAFLEAL